MKSRSRKYLSLLTAAVCIVTLLTGCGDDTAVHTGTEARTEEITETSGDTADNGKEEAAAQEDGREEQMQTNASRAQIEIDEETKGTDGTAAGGREAGYFGDGIRTCHEGLYL